APRQGLCGAARHRRARRRPGRTGRTKGAVARMERSAMRGHRSRITLRSIRATKSFRNGRETFMARTMAEKAATAAKKSKPAKAPKPSARRYGDILYEVKDGVAWVTINRPRVMNAFREQTLDELIDALRSTREDPSIACAVVTGAGDKAF